MRTERLDLYSSHRILDIIVQISFSVTTLSLRDINLYVQKYMVGKYLNETEPEICQICFWTLWRMY